MWVICVIWISLLATSAAIATANRVSQQSINFNFNFNLNYELYCVVVAAVTIAVAVAVDDVVDDGIKSFRFAFFHRTLNVYNFCLCCWSVCFVWLHSFVALPCLCCRWCLYLLFIRSSVFGMDFGFAIVAWLCCSLMHATLAWLDFGSNSILNAAITIFGYKVVSFQNLTQHLAFLKFCLTLAWALVFIDIENLCHYLNFLNSMLWCKS